MGARYLTDLAAVCRRTGWPVVEVDGWPYRARGSGGYDGGRPNHVMVHHTASGPGSDGWPDVNYMTYGSGDAPLCNLYIDRGGVIYVCAGGATNTNGSGSDPCGTISPDTMNSSAVGIECGNGGTGETWPPAQLDSLTAVCRELGAAYGIPTGRIHGHAEWAPSRKIDPAGPPRYATGKATWDMAAFRADCSSTPDPDPDPDEQDDEMARQALIIISGPGGATPGATAVTDPALAAKTFVTGADAGALQAIGYETVTVDGATFDRIPGVRPVDVT